MRKSEEEVVLSVRNRVKKDLNLVDGQLPRISQKGAGHGFGLWNVQDVLKKYGGEYTISCGSAGSALPAPSRSASYDMKPCRI